MAKKRKSLATRLDEVDRTMYSTFSTGANSLSQLYAQAMNQQKLSFQAGERHGLGPFVLQITVCVILLPEKLYQWILKQQEEGTRVTTFDILGYLQAAADLDSYGEDPTLLSCRAPLQSNPGFSGSSGAITAGFRSDPNDQNSKDNVSTDALASPIRLSLQNYHIGEGRYYPNSQPLDQPQNDRDPHDNSMDMHADSS